jgi:hypothetical protein
MSKQLNLINMIHALTEKMHVHCSAGEWDLLAEADSIRATFVKQLAGETELDACCPGIIASIQEKQDQILEMVIAEQRRLGNEYMLEQEKQTASGSYLKYMENTLT